MRSIVLAVFAVAILTMIPLSHASYSVTNLNVTVALNKNTSAQVTEILTMIISNSSVQQYTTNRVALNLTLSNWQNIIGPLLVQHIINPYKGVYNFKFLPGSVTNINGQNYAYLLMSYEVSNVTVVNQTAPRNFVYRFNPAVFNFEHGASGQVLNPNTTLTIVLPSGSQIKSVYPIPDYPPSAFTNDYANTTRVSWLYGEPLSKFTLTFVITEGIQAEVVGFFGQIYKELGIFTYLIIAIIILAFILYAYFRVGR
ncbi:MAG: hypothetical protein KGH60_03405 [Candidatus Micrarchaeota archaeon]|nr:hypothetical protein [Candidatus Micrarchaeota archaeon]